MWEYDLKLKNDKVRIYEILLLFIFILNLIAFQIINRFTHTPFFNLAWGFVFILMFAYRLAGTRFKQILLFWLSVAGIETLWIWSGHWQTGMIMLLLFILFAISRRELIVHISTDAIIYPSFPARKIKWNELSNIILKDDWLTIDFKNNKIIQQKIENNTKLKEEEFNELCKRRLIS